MSLPLPVAIVGLGHIGRIHLQSYRALKALGLVSRIVALDTDPEVRMNLDAVEGDDIEVIVGAEREVPEDVKAVSVCVPPQHHGAITLPLLRRGLAVLVEKPLTPSSREARSLIDVARAHGASLFVGHSERFNRVVRAALVADCHDVGDIQHIEAARHSPRSPRHEGIDIILDLMIHDIDLMLALTGDRVVDVDAVGAALHSARLDFVAAQLKLSRGTTVHLTARRFAAHPNRHFTWHGRGLRRTHLDLLAGHGNHHDPTGNATTALMLPEHAPDALTAQLEAFLLQGPLAQSCAAPTLPSNTLPVATAEDGLLAIEIAERIRAALSRAGTRDSEWSGVTK